MKKYFKKLQILVLLFFLFQGHFAFAQSKYSNESILIYNSGVALHNQGKYELAEQKYNQALTLQPDFVEAKKNLAVLYQNLAGKYYGEANYDMSIYYSKKSLSLDSKNITACNILAKCYYELNDYENASEEFKKIISLTPDDDTAMNMLASIYMKTNQIDSALDLYKKMLLINPNDTVAQQNFKCANYLHSEKVLNASINNLSIGHIAPTALYKLIKPSAGITSTTVERVKTILDLVWSEPNGQIMLQAILNKKVPINITQGAINANLMKMQRKNTFYLYGFIPVASFTTSSLAVNIPFNYVSDFNSPNLSSHQRIYDLQVFIHEFGHTFMAIKNPNNIDSVEEELGVSMIGYNISYKIIAGKYLDKEQTEIYSMESLEALLNDEHRNLPVFSGFNSTIQNYGIIMPYPEVYSNLPLMYKKLLAEKRTAPVPNFYQYVR